MPRPHHPARTWLAIWPHPRSAIRSYVDHTDDGDLHILAPSLLLTAVHLVAPNVALWRSNDGRGALYLVLLAFIAVAVAQVGLWFYTGILWRVGRAAGGIADHRAVLAAYLWSHVPWLVGMVLCIPHDVAMVVHGHRPGPDAWLPPLGKAGSGVEALWIAGTALIAYSLATHLVCQSEVQGYGVRRALLVDLLIAAGAAVILVPLMMLALKLP